MQVSQLNSENYYKWRRPAIAVARVGCACPGGSGAAAEEAAFGEGHLPRRLHQRLQPARESRHCNTLVFQNIIILQVGKLQA